MEVQKKKYFIMKKKNNRRNIEKTMRMKIY